MPVRLEADRNDGPTLPEIKRFLELCMAGAHFREALGLDREATLARYGLAHLDVEALAPLYAPGAPAAEVAPVVREYWQYRQEAGQRLREIKEACVPGHERFRRWHRRQSARCRLEMGSAMDGLIIHTPFAAELSLGCSVGCWYCSLDAPPLSQVYAYTDENRALWREVLGQLRILGEEAMAWGSVYWASEPLDNPDLERFCEDFHEILGRFPQVTTALPLRDPERVRRLLDLSRAKGSPGNRFSVNSLSALERIMATFSAQELAHTELVLQNPEAGSVKAAAGRGLRHFQKRPATLARELKKRVPADSAISITPENPLALLPGTNACVTGFLVNMVERRVRLISPCNASERWPLGYRVFAEACFRDGAGFQQAIAGMVAQMVVDLPEERPLRLAPYLHYREEEGKALLESSCQRLEFSIQGPGARLLGEVLRLLAAGKSPLGAISIHCACSFGAADALTRRILDDLLQQGVLDEDCLEGLTP